METKRGRSSSSMNRSKLSSATAPQCTPFANPELLDDSQSYQLEVKQSLSPSLSEISNFRSPTVRPGKHKFKSYRLKDQYSQPWRNHPRLTRTKLNNHIVTFFIAVGVVLSAVICFLASLTVEKRPYCLVLEDYFESIDPGVWNHMVQLDGFGTGSFDWTTTDPANSYVNEEGLHIIPTLTNETTDINNDMIYNGYTLNLTGAGAYDTCTGLAAEACSVSSNSTLGILIPPVRSARLTTQGKKTIKFGRVEVTARMPVGDWLWPAIWMMPEDSVYGVWPQSGEIDIMEARGNNYSYPGGRDVYSTTLHWGPSPDTDAFWRTTSQKALRRTDYSEAFHTFGVEWTEKYLFFYVDTRLQEVLFVSFDTQDFWERGNFATMGDSSEFLENPWSQTDSKSAPFDQEFYLILNVAVGSRNGWFPDKVDEKPWLDGSTDAQWDFYSSASNWLPTWGKGEARGMTVKSVKMWQEGACQ